MHCIETAKMLSVHVHFYRCIVEISFQSRCISVVEAYIEQNSDRFTCNGYCFLGGTTHNVGLSVCRSQVWCCPLVRASSILPDMKKSRFSTYICLYLGRDIGYRKTSNTSRVSNRSRVSNTSRWFWSLVLIEAGSVIQAGSPIQAGGSRAFVLEAGGLYQKFYGTNFYCAI